MPEVFPLTRDQMHQYLDWCEREQRVFAGIAHDGSECPLARAYRHFHPEAQAIYVGHFTAEVDGQEYILDLWQNAVVAAVDGSEETAFALPIPIGKVRSLLAL